MLIQDGHNSQHRRAKEVGDRVVEVGGLYPAKQVSGESAEDGQRPKDRDHLQHKMVFSKSLPGKCVVLLVRDHAARQRHAVGEVVHACDLDNDSLVQTSS